MGNTGSLILRDQTPVIELVNYLRWRSIDMYGSLADRIESGGSLDGATILHHHTGGHLYVLFDEFGVDNKWHRTYLERDIELAAQGAFAYIIQNMVRGLKERSLFSIVLRAHRERKRAAVTLQRAYRAMKQRRITNFLQLAQITVTRSRAVKSAGRALENAVQARVAIANTASLMSSMFGGDKNKALLMGFVRKVANCSTEDRLMQTLNEAIVFVETKLDAMPRGLDEEAVLKPLKTKRIKDRAKGTWSDAVDDEYRRFGAALRVLVHGPETADDGDESDSEATGDGPDGAVLEVVIQDDPADIDIELDADSEGPSLELSGIREMPIQNQQRDDALILCCMEGGLACRTRVKQLIEVNKADIHLATHDWRGNTPLHYAALSGDAEMCELLVSLGADVNRPNRDGGNTPLHLAFYIGEPFVAEALLKNGADYELRNRSHDLIPLQMIDFRNSGGTVSIVASTFRSERRAVKGKIPDKPARKPSCKLRNAETWIDIRLKKSLSEHIEEMDAVADAETVITDTSSEADSSSSTITDMSLSHADLMDDVTSLGKGFARRASSFSGMRPHLNLGRPSFMRHSAHDSPGAGGDHEPGGSILEEGSDESSTSSSASSKTTLKTASSDNTKSTAKSKKSSKKSLLSSLSLGQKVHPVGAAEDAAESTTRGGDDTSVTTVEDQTILSSQAGAGTIISGISSKAPHWEEKGHAEPDIKE